MTPHSEESRPDASSEARETRDTLLAEARNYTEIVVGQVGRRVRQARQSAGLSQTELARAVGYTAANPISKLESGRIASVDLVMLCRIARATSTPLRSFVVGLEAGHDVLDRVVQAQRAQFHLLKGIERKLEELIERVGERPTLSDLPDLTHRPNGPPH